MSRFGASFRSAFTSNADGDYDLDDELSIGGGGDEMTLVRAVRRWFTPRLLLLTLVLYVFLWWNITSLTLFNYALCCQPLSSEETEMVCQTTNITLGSSIREGAFQYTGAATARTLLAVTSLYRTVECVYVNQHADDTDDEKMRRFTYQRDYLNISSIDVEAIVVKEHELFPLQKEYTMWYYVDQQGFCTVSHWKHASIDENCLTPEAFATDALSHHGERFGLSFAAHLIVILIVTVLHALIHVCHIIATRYTRYTKV
jgi:hypothetical protein